MDFIPYSQSGGGQYVDSFQTISAQRQYINFSVEELRSIDYKQRRSTSQLQRRATPAFSEVKENEKPDLYATMYLVIPMLKPLDYVAPESRYMSANWRLRQRTTNGAFLRNLYHVSPLSFALLVRRTSKNTTTPASNSQRMMYRCSVYSWNSCIMDNTT